MPSVGGVRLLLLLGGTLAAIAVDARLVVPSPAAEDTAQAQEDDDGDGQEQQGRQSSWPVMGTRVRPQWGPGWG